MAQQYRICLQCRRHGCGRPQSMRSRKSWTGPNNSAILLSLTFIKLMRILPLIVLLFMFYMINHFVFAVFKIFLFIFAFSAFERFHKSFYHSCSGRAFPYSPNTFHGSWISHLFFLFFYNNSSLLHGFKYTDQSCSLKFNSCVQLKPVSTFLNTNSKGLPLKSLSEPCAKRLSTSSKDCFFETKRYLLMRLSL